MTAPVHVFGIRHHGPGSARRLVEALDALRPAVVLIEGPSDLSELLPLLADPEMVPPVALLAYAADEPSRAVFWPFAAFSPERQAALWAVREGAEVRFIDLPAAWSLGQATEAEDGADQTARGAEPVEPPALAARLERDPIGLLAEAAGYEDGESWWRDVIEENPDPGPVFAAVADAMTALRETAPPLGDTKRRARRACGCRSRSPLQRRTAPSPSSAGPGTFRRWSRAYRLRRTGSG